MSKISEKCVTFISVYGIMLKRTFSAVNFYTEKKGRSMDNNNKQRPRKRVTKEVLRRRQFTALAVIFFILLMIVLLVAKGCSKNESSEDDAPPINSTAITSGTVPAESEAAVTGPVEEITEAPTAEAVPTESPTTVPENPNTITKIEVDRHEIYLGVGQTDMPTVIMSPETSTEKGEIWTSSDTSIATVDAYGTITGVAPGTCFITVQAQNNPSVEAAIRVNVTLDGGAGYDNGGYDDGGYGEDYGYGDYGYGEDYGYDEYGYAYTSKGRASQNATPLNMKEDSKKSSKPKSNAADAPLPPVYPNEGLTYIKDILIVNKDIGMPEDFNPGLEDICASQFQKLSEDAAKSGLNIYLGSGFRSYDQQVIVYNDYVARDGKQAADTFSARPGHSEHQTGLTIDCNTITDDFGYTDEAFWLAKHAHEYGFIIRYEKGKEDITGYKYEPWHIRYVGSEAATYMYENNLCLEEYLGLA